MAVGLDIGSSTVRLVRLERRRGNVRLSHVAKAALPRGAVVDGDVVDPPAVAGVVGDLWRGAGVRQRDVAVGLASPRITVRQIELPDLPEKELPGAVRLQAEDQLPIPVDQAVLDHIVVERGGDGDQRRVRVLLVAAEREMVDRRLAAVKAVKLRPVLVDLDVFALLRSLDASTPPGDGVELIVDIGAMVTKIAVHRAGHPLFVRMVRNGGDAATRQLEKVLDLPWHEAEAAKLSGSASMALGTELGPEDERARALETAVQRVVTEVSNSLDFFRSQHDDVEVQRVVLSGGASLAPDLADRLEVALELPVRRGDPLRGLEVPNGDGVGVTEQERPFLGVAVGLALGALP